MRHVLLSLLASIAIIAAPIAVSAQERSTVSGINAWGDLHGGWARLPGKDLNGWFNTNVNQPAPPPPDPCDGGLCTIINSKGDKQAGLLLGGEARVALPVGQDFGLQGDVGVDRVEDSWISTNRLHFFLGLGGWGTAGLAAQHTSIGKAHTWRLGLEGQLWLDRFSLYGYAGGQLGDSSRKWDVERGHFFCGEARVYVTDNAVLGIGGGTGPSKNFLQANGEFQFEGSLQPVSIFVRGAIGDSAYRTVMAGVRLHWGNASTLITRHRQDMLIPYAACGVEQFDHRDIGRYFLNAG